MNEKLILSVHIRVQLCQTLCDPLDYSPIGFSVHSILQARILEWVAMPSSRGSSPPRDLTQVSYVSCIAKHIRATLEVQKVLSDDNKYPAEN